MPSISLNNSLLNLERKIVKILRFEMVIGTTHKIYVFNKNQKIKRIVETCPADLHKQP